MSSYSTLSTQITALQNDMTVSLAAGGLSSTDYAYYANALSTLGTLLGINDIVAATASYVSQITTAGTTQVNAVNSAGTTQVAAVNSAGSTQITAINNTATTLQLQAFMGVLA
jgi:hypothetical protein